MEHSDDPRRVNAMVQVCRMGIYREQEAFVGSWWPVQEGSEIIDVFQRSPLRVIFPQITEVGLKKAVLINTEGASREATGSNAV